MHVVQVLTLATPLAGQHGGATVLMEVVPVLATDVIGTNLDALTLSYRMAGSTRAVFKQLLSEICFFVWLMI